MLKRIMEALGNYVRVLRACKKPIWEEFIMSLKICVLGSVLIGLIGFLFYLAFLLIGV
jgi:protein translocase SEC61 complex gamma subunit